MMFKDQKRVVISGYFDPLHCGHIEYMRLAKKLAGRKGKMIVILNNDRQTLKKNEKIFMPLEERRKIIEAIKYVDEVYISIDEDDSVCKSLEVLNPNVFGNGGDKVVVPEIGICNKLNIKMVYNLGKKIQSSETLKTRWEER